MRRVTQRQTADAASQSPGRPCSPGPVRRICPAIAPAQSSNRMTPPDIARPIGAAPARRQGCGQRETTGPAAPDRRAANGPPSTVTAHSATLHPGTGRDPVHPGIQPQVVGVDGQPRDSRQGSASGLTATARSARLGIRTACHRDDTGRPRGAGCRAMTRPLIGITTYRENASWGAWNTGGRGAGARRLRRRCPRRRRHAAADPAARTRRRRGGHHAPARRPGAGRRSRRQPIPVQRGTGPGHHQLAGRSGRVGDGPAERRRRPRIAGAGHLPGHAGDGRDGRRCTAATRSGRHRA